MVKIDFYARDSFLANVPPTGTRGQGRPSTASRKVSESLEMLLNASLSINRDPNWTPDLLFVT